MLVPQSPPQVTQPPALFEMARTIATRAQPLAARFGHIVPKTAPVVCDADRRPRGFLTWVPPLSDTDTLVMLPRTANEAPVILPPRWLPYYNRGHEVVTVPAGVQRLELSNSRDADAAAVLYCRVKPGDDNAIKSAKANFPSPSQLQLLAEMLHAPGTSTTARIGAEIGAWGHEILLVEPIKTWSACRYKLEDAMGCRGLAAQHKDLRGRVALHRANALLYAANNPSLSSLELLLAEKDEQRAAELKLRLPPAGEQREIQYAPLVGNHGGEKVSRLAGCSSTAG